MRALIVHTFLFNYDLSRVNGTYNLFRKKIQKFEEIFANGPTEFEVSANTMSRI
jgi:hypothetical protein